MAKKNAVVKVSAIVTVSDVMETIVEICKKAGTYHDYSTTFKAVMVESELSKNDGQNIAHWLLTPARIALIAKGSMVSVKNLTIACEAIAGTKIELHRVQQAIVKFYETEGIKVSFDRKGYHALVEKLSKPAKAKSTKAEPPAETETPAETATA